ncbi:MAG: methylated-DNA--[protein]-cysteine S-methyltransferase [Lysobacter sp.]|nr:methylated-DNA--[protein]-cysteine S-methyltransferase [Lysobacter sp.]
MSTLYMETLDTPIGTLVLAADAEGLRHIEFPSNRHPVSRESWVPGADGAAAGILAMTAQQLREYFDGARRDFELPLAPRGTEFQMQVWHTLATIPFGATWSYGALARAIGKPDAMRAVGAANGRNPLPIVLPCHRVIGADGSLTGFGGGLPIKEALLRLEGALPVSARTPGLFD